MVELQLGTLRRFPPTDLFSITFPLPSILLQNILFFS